MLEDYDDRVVLEIPMAPRELREDFPRMIHLHYLWAIIRVHETSIKGRTPCRLSYRQLGILLAREMGRELPYRVGTIKGYILLLRNKGWVKTFQIVYPDTRQSIVRPGCVRKSQKSYPAQQFVNYARNASNGVALIVCCVFVKNGIRFTKKSQSIVRPGHVGSIPYVLLTNISNTNLEELCSFCEANKKEIKGLLNMKGFHTYFEKSDNPTEQGLAFARQLYDDNCKHAVRMKKIRITQWAFIFDWLMATYPDFPIVFEWLLATRQTDAGLRRWIQSPRRIKEEWEAIKERAQRNKANTKNYIPDGYYDNEEYVNECSLILRKEFPKECSRIDEIWEHELGVGIYNMKYWASVTMQAPLDRLVTRYSKNSDMWNVAYDLRYNVTENDALFLTGLRGILKGLSIWSEWKGYFRKKSIMGLIETDDGVSLNRHAREWFIFMMNKKGEQSIQRHNKILAAIHEELNNA